MIELIERIVKYWQWADQSVWNLVQGLSDEEFTKCFEKGPSIHQRYIHLAEDSWEWYTDWTGADIEEEPDFQAMSKEELFDFISEYNTKWEHLLQSDKIKTIEVGTIEKMIPITFPEIIFHMSNHATYHRGQIIMTLRMLGKEVQFTDYVPFKLQT